MKLTRKSIVAVARSLVDVKFRHAGRNIHGVDCVGVLAFIAKQHGYSFEDRVHYPQEADGELEGTLLRFLDRGPSLEWEDGDVLLFWCDPGHKRPQHVGVATSVGMVHALRLEGKVVETSLGRWEHRLVAVLKWRNLEA